MPRRRVETAPPAPEARDTIPTAQLLQRLEDHALGKVEMSSTEVRAAEILLKKRLPDLSTMAMAARACTLEEMLEAIGAGGARKA
jgi:hypothetical protein